MEQLSLFDSQEPGSGSQPLAARLRPENLEEYVGQQHLIGPGRILRRLIERDQIASMIFWGPPGVGKTTLARIIAKHTKASFIDFSAVTSGIREIREVMQKAENNSRYGEKTIVFVDEIHRFNKAQQDAFLPFVEKGSIILIGATTENPSFEVNGALLSRCKVFVLKPLAEDSLADRGIIGDLVLIVIRFGTADDLECLDLLGLTVEFGSAQNDAASGADSIGRERGDNLRMLEGIFELLDLIFRNFSELKTECHILKNGHVRIKSVVLENHGDISVLRNDIVHQFSFDVKFAAGNIFEAGNHTQCSGLAAS